MSQYILTVEVPSKEYCDLIEFWEILKTTYTTSSLKNLEYVEHWNSIWQYVLNFHGVILMGMKRLAHHTYARCRLLYLRVRIFMHNLMKLEIVLKSYYPVMKGKVQVSTRLYFGVSAEYCNIWHSWRFNAYSLCLNIFRVRKRLWISRTKTKRISCTVSHMLENRCGTCAETISIY